MLRLENVSAGYGNRQVLFDVSFSVGESEIGLLVGSNGSGKSTVLKTIYGLLPLINKPVGKIIFNGENIDGLETSQLLNKGLLYVPQKNSCFDTLTVKENLEISGLGLNSKKRYKERLEYVINLFPALKASFSQLPMKMSGGEKQLLSLAMAALHKPKLIMVDEPFAGLSSQNAESVKRHIQQLNRTEGIAFLIVEHRVKEFFDTECQLIGLKMGRVLVTRQVSNGIASVLLNEILI